MKTSKRIGQAIEAGRRSYIDVAERVKLAFALSLERRRRDLALTNTQLASAMEVSPAYMTKVFRGDCNLTIESMAKLAAATDSDLQIILRSNTAGVTTQSVEGNGDTPRFPQAAVEKLIRDIETLSSSTATATAVGAANDLRFAFAA